VRVLGEWSSARVWRSRVYRYRLIAGRCRSCGRAHYPPANACPYCSSRDLDEVELPRVGRLISYSVVYATPFEDRDRSPVVIGLIDLGIARLVAEVVDVKPGDLRVGDRVEAVFRRIAVDGNTGLIVYGIKFRPVRVG